MITKFSTGLLFLALLLNSCQQRNQPTSPQYEAEYNRSTTPALIDIEKALDHPAMLKLSQIASKLEYYNVGDARYTVTQAIAIPDSDAFITFNNPRIYYRKQGIPSKRYGFKALDYKWNHGMNGLNLFYDRKTTRMYCALSGLDQDNKKRFDHIQRYKAMYRGITHIRYDADHSELYIPRKPAYQIFDKCGCQSNSRLLLLGIYAL